MSKYCHFCSLARIEAGHSRFVRGAGLTGLRIVIEELEWEEG
jgi:hypothetical protein